MSSIKRALEPAQSCPRTDKTHHHKGNLLCPHDENVQPPSKRRRLSMKPFMSSVEGKSNHTRDDKTGPTIAALRKLDLSSSTENDKENRSDSILEELDRSTEIRDSRSSLFDGRRTSGLTRLMNLTLGIHLQIGTRSFILIQPSFAKGAYAHCSIWLGVNDSKLYVRKLQTCSDQIFRDISHHISHPNIPALVASIKHGRNPNLLRETSQHNDRLDEAVRWRQRNLASMN